MGSAGLLQLVSHLQQANIRMKNAISISEIIGTIEDDQVEVCAIAEADYDRAKERAIVSLNAFARRVSVRGHGEPVPAPWLPTSEEVTEHLTREEVDSFAKDVFHSWVKKVRASVPEALHLHE